LFFRPYPAAPESNPEECGSTEVLGKRVVQGRRNSKDRRHRTSLRAAFLASVLTSFLIGLLTVQRAAALDIELDDVAPDRVERQRAYARGAVPFPNTPDLADIDNRLAAKGLKRGDPVFLRLFKATSELELWMLKDNAFVLLDTYPVCHWTGTLGPKIHEGDKQSPEGFYGVTYRQTRLVGRWRKAFNIGYPNRLDQINKRTGSYILMHGGCSSTGCFAMTDQVQREIFSLVEAALRHGQKRVDVQIFPFRMTAENMEAHKDSIWASFWSDLKAGYDSFERTRLPPRIAICSQRYNVSDGALEDIGATPRLMPILPPSACAAPGDKDRELGEADHSDPVSAVHPLAATPAPSPATLDPSSKSRRKPRLHARHAGRELRAEREPLASEQPLLRSLGERPIRDPRTTSGGG
jgi:murein L,D-transpeptidase YafK